MKNIFATLCILMLLMALPTKATTYYLSTSGSDSYSGTSSSSPFASLAYAVSKLSAGDVLYVSGGTYYEDSAPIIVRTSGSSSSPITVSGNESNRPVFHFDGRESSTNRGIVLDADYWIWKSVIIENAGDNGMLLAGNNNTINNCVFRGNHDTGLQLSRYSSSATSISEWPSNNYIVNCEAYDNCDSDNEDADGFAAKLTCGEGNTFENCVSHHNIDDGWDLYTKSDTGPIGVVTFINCIAHSNGTLSDGSASGSGDKNGFKLGSSSNTVNHILVRCVAFNNGHHGFTDNGNIGSIKFINLTSYNNSDYNYHTRDNARHEFVNCISYDGQDRIVGTASSSCNALIDDDYSFNYTVSSSDFESLSPGDDDDPCGNGFLHLASSSDLIDAGCSSGYLDSYSGSAPDLGAFEYGASDDDDDDNDDEGYISLTASSGDGYVYLSWAIHNITNTGTEVYRDTDSDPSGRVRIASPGSATTYTDTDVTNGTTYYYWIKVKDSDGTYYNSDAVAATPTSSGSGVGSDSDIIEDDDSRLISYDGSLKSYASANNGYAINLSNSAGKQIVWNYSASSSSTYTISLRYTRKSSMGSSANIYINGVQTNEISLSETESGVFTTSSFTATLVSGTNEIILETAEDGEFADIDYVAFASSRTKVANLGAHTAMADKELILGQNYPNPVLNSSTIPFTIPSESQVKLIVTNINGQQATTLIDKKLNAGAHSFIINPQAGNLSAGIYIYTLITNEGSVSKKMIIK